MSSMSLQIYRYIVENHHEPIAIVAGIVQTVLYCDFFYLYITKGIYKQLFISYENKINFVYKHIPQMIYIYLILCS